MNMSMTAARCTQQATVNKEVARPMVVHYIDLVQHRYTSCSAVYHCNAHQWSCQSTEALHVLHTRSQRQENLENAVVWRI